MSYPVQPPLIAATPPPSPIGRPPAVTLAAALLWVMAGVGLVYAIVTLAIVPGTISRFRDVTGGPPSLGFSDDNNPDYYVAVVWLGAAIALALAVIAFALFVVIGLSLRRGSNAARIATLVVCVLGVLGGGVGVLTVAAERSGNTAPWTLGAQLSDAYPGGWIGTNAALSVAQILGYVLVAILVLTVPRAFFRRPAAPTVPQQAYGTPQQAYGTPQQAYGTPQQAYGTLPYPGYGPGNSPAAPGLWDPAGPARSAGAHGPGASQHGYSAVPGPGGFSAGPGQSGYQVDAGRVGYPAGPGNPGGGSGGGQSGAGYPSPTGYGPGGNPPGSGPAPAYWAGFPQGPAQPARSPDHSPYARQAGYAPDAFVPAAPAVPPPASEPSPYARPPQDQPEAVLNGPHAVLASEPIVSESAVSGSATAESTTPTSVDADSAQARPDRPAGDQAQPSPVAGPGAADAEPPTRA